MNTLGRTAALLSITTIFFVISPKMVFNSANASSVTSAPSAVTSGQKEKHKEAGDALAPDTTFNKELYEYRLEQVEKYDDKLHEHMETWLALYGVIFGFIAIAIAGAGVVIPYLVTRQKLDEVIGIKNEIESIRDDLTHKAEQVIQEAKQKTDKSLQELDEETKRRLATTLEIAKSSPSVKEVPPALATAGQGNNAPKEDKTLTDLRARASQLEKDKKWLDAIRIYKTILEIKPDDNDVIFRVAYDAGEASNLSNDPAQTKSLREEAIDYYKKYLSMRPTDNSALYNLTIEYLGLASLQSEEAARLSAKEAISTVLKLSDASKKQSKVLIVWGRSLYAFANFEKDITEKTARYKESIDKFVNALQAADDKQKSLAYWFLSDISSNLAKITMDSVERKKYHDSAISNLEKSLEIGGPDKAKLDALTGKLLTCSYSKSGEERRVLFAKTREYLNQLEKISPESGQYNAACLEALLGDVDKCLERLEKAHGFGTLPTREHMENDSDLDGVRNHEKIKDFMRRIFGGSR